MKIHTIVDFKILKFDKIHVYFDDGVNGIVEISKLYDLSSPLASRLRDEPFFMQAKLNKEWGHIEWPNGLDPAPSKMYEALVSN